MSTPWALSFLAISGPVSLRNFSTLPPPPMKVYVSSGREPMKPSATSSCRRSMGNMALTSLLISELSKPPWVTIRFDDGVSKGMTRYEKSPDVLNGVWSFLWMPPAVMKATLHSLSGFFNSVNTGFGVTGTKISERIPSTVVKFITTPPIVHLQPPWG